MSDLSESIRQLGDAVHSQEPAAVSGCRFIHTCPIHMMPALATVFREAGFFLEMLTCLDVRKEENAFRLVYQFSRPDIPERHRVLSMISPGEAAPTLSLIFESANWYEREVYDMFGVSFADHPNLTRILTEEGADYHPLLRDFGVPEPEVKGAANA